MDMWNLTLAPNVVLAPPLEENGSGMAFKGTTEDIAKALESLDPTFADSVD
jgi:hypothetical protein